MSPRSVVSGASAARRRQCRTREGIRIKNILSLAAGFALLGFGAVGLVLPVWPTTPFVLAAAACFAVSPRLQAWLIRLPFFGEHIRNYQNRTGLSRRTLIVSLAFLWGMLAFSCLLTRKVWLLALLFAVGAAVTVHLVWMARPRGRAALRKEESA